MEQQYINSPIFGKTRLPDDHERKGIKFVIEDCPLGVFQELNKYLNTKGFMISIKPMEDNNG